MPDVIDHELEVNGYIPVFVDGSGMEVRGSNYEGAHGGYKDEKQYWLHPVFVGWLGVSCRLFRGGVDVAVGVEGAT